MSHSPSSSPRTDTESFKNSHSWARTFLELIIFAAAFYLAYKASNARLWLPDSVLLVALLFTPRKRWWLFLLIPLFVRYFVGRGATLATPIFLANYFNDILKALIGASILRWLNNGPPKLATIRELFQFFAVVVVLTPALSAFAGAATRVSLGEDYWTSWQIWFLGDALANLILTPMLLYWISEGTDAIRNASRWRWLEATLLYGGIIVIGILGLRGETGGIGSSPLLANLTLPLLLYAAVRFGPRGVSTAIVVATTFVVWNAKVLGRGPFAVQSPGTEILWIQMVFYAVSIPLLCVAVLLRQSNENEQTAIENQHRAQELAGRLISLQDEERGRIAHALHDTLGQSLTLIQITAETTKQSSDDRPDVTQHLTEISETAATAHQEVREIVHNLRPAGLDHFGLGHAVKVVVRRLSNSTPIELVADVDPIEGLLTKDEETSVYRIVQEGLNNVIKHSKATQATISLKRTTDGIEVVIEDNGIGMDVESDADGDGFGLSGISERVRLLGGAFSIDSTPGYGTRLTIKIARAKQEGATA